MRKEKKKINKIARHLFFFFFFSWRWGTTRNRQIRACYLHLSLYRIINIFRGGNTFSVYKNCGLKEKKKNLPRVQSF